MKKKSKFKSVLAWHFLPDNGHLRYGDKVKVEVGQTLKVDADKLELCSFGLHASKRLIDALEYAPGGIICRVKLSVHSTQKKGADELPIHVCMRLLKLSINTSQAKWVLMRGVLRGVLWRVLWRVLKISASRKRS